MLQKYNHFETALENGDPTRLGDDQLFDNMMTVPLWNIIICIITVDHTNDGVGGEGGIPS
jgi:hypothetical protein